MTWRERHESLTLNGVEIFYNTVTSSFGRRTKQFESVQEAGAQFEDLERGPRDFVINGFISGDDFDIKVAKLRNVTEGKGPYKLVHPFHGTYNVCLAEGSKVSVEESRTKLGQATVSMTLVEDGFDTIVPFKNSLPTAQAAIQAAKGLQQARTAKRFKNPLGEFSKGVSAALNRVAREISAVNGRARVAAQYVGDIAVGFSQIEDQITNFKNNPAYMVSAFAQLIASVFGVLRTFPTNVEDLPGLAVAPAKNIAALAMGFAYTFTKLDLNGYKSVQKIGPQKSTQQEIQERSIEELQLFVKVTALQETALILLDPSTTYESANQAEEARDKIVAYLDDLIFNEKVEGATYAAMTNMRSLVYKELTEISLTLPRLTKFTPKRTTPALVLAYDLYQDPFRYREIVNRNRIKHPLFVLGGVEIEVLAYD